MGTLLGTVAALNQNKAGDYSVIALATAGSTIPTFVIAPIIQLVFGLSWKLLPIGGWGDGALLNKIGPVLTLALPHIAIVAQELLGRTSRGAIEPAWAVQPNPGRRMLTVSVHSDKVQQIGLTAADALGRVVRTQSMTVGSGKTMIPLNLEGAAAGVYIVQLGLEQERYVRRVVVR